MKIRRNSLDRRFSIYIRRRDKFTCQRCGKYFPEEKLQGLHAAHIFSRSRKSTRYDPKCVISFCFGCHSYLDANPLEKYEWYIRKYGRKEFDQLRMRANTPGKLDWKLIDIWLKQEEENFNKGVSNGQ